MAAFSAAAGLAGGASILGGIMGSNSAKKANKLFQAYVNAAGGEIRRGRDVAVDYGKDAYNLLNPYGEGGDKGFNLLADFLTGKRPMTDMEQFSPGYNFRLDQGQQALEAKQRMGGFSMSGPATKEFMDFNQGMASSEFNNYLAQLFQLGNMGATARTGQAGILTNIGDRYTHAADANANLLMGGGQSAANSQMAGSAAMSSGINNAFNIFSSMQNNQQWLDLIKGLPAGGK